ncbi:MAG: DNA starvation/stationary phase protection protein [Paracoccaceae bacterium]
MAEIAADLTPDAQSEIVEALTQAVAEISVETMKAQNFHWNVTGMAFGPLHDLFQEIYEDHFEAQDDLAERVKALGAHAEGRLSSFLARSKVEESDGHLPAEKMVAALAEDQKTIAGTLLALADLSEKHGDMITNDMAIGRAQQHEKFAWMLRAHLG